MCRIETHARRYSSSICSIYGLVALIVYKCPHFRPIAEAIELSWRPEGEQPNRGALYRVCISSARVMRTGPRIS